jgi:hypothetical protein
MPLLKFDRRLRHLLAKRHSTDKDAGFSLIESAVALTTLGVCLAYSMPMFMYARLNNTRSEVNTGASLAAERTFDYFKSLPLKDVPTLSSLGLNNAASRTVYLCDKISGSDVSLASVDDTTAGCTGAVHTAPIVESMGNFYFVSAQFCETGMLCNENARTFRVEVRYCKRDAATPNQITTGNLVSTCKTTTSEQLVYQMQATYTSFQ